MARFKDINWDVTAATSDPQAAKDVHEATLAVLMDIRDELKILNRVFQCGNALAIPDLLRDIKKNTTKPKRRKR